MNDEMKNKSGKVKVMYVRSDDDSDKRTQKSAYRKRVAGVRRPLVQTVAVAPPAMTEIPVMMTAKRDDRKRSDRPRSDRPRDDRPRDDFSRDNASPWRTVSRAPGR